MLAMLGLLGVVVAGVALPMAFGGETDEDDAETEGRDETLPPRAVADPEEVDPEGPDEEALLAGPLTTGSEGAETPPDPTEAIEDVLLAPEATAPISGGPGDDLVQGGAENDMLWGDFGDDLLAGGAGDDLLIDGAGSDTLVGGDGDDTLNTTTADGEWAADGRDELHGGDGDDVLVLSSSDYATGGAGGDVFYVGSGIAEVAEEEAPQIGDFDPEQDSLVVVWNDYAAESPPSIEISPAVLPGAVQVLADGELVAHLTTTNPVAVDEIKLLAASDLV